MAVVRISVGTLPDVNTGKRRSISPLPLTITFSGTATLPNALLRRRYSSASSGKMASAVQTCRRSTPKVPEPTITTSAMARNRPITMRSWALCPLMSPPLACPFTLSETTPSRVVTKLL